ncbi:hypothetical protein [uncultured Phenylobacterium sp.]|uniref:DUF4870 family protein n=1 Tax=uncultured Phenylobacterium sp. TaxID=349273 RepID=UPI0025DD4221|nr:hypothetical protein [uncultured Phenylobacterium sp.]
MSDYSATEDKTMPIVCYALYLAGFATAGLTAIVGVIIAHAQQMTAGPDMRTHYTFLIRTFWIGLVWCLLASLLLVVGIPLSFILIGIPLLILAKLMYGVAAIWFGVRCILGLITLSRGEPYPRPYAVLA